MISSWPADLCALRLLTDFLSSSRLNGFLFADGRKSPSFCGVMYLSDSLLHRLLHIALPSTDSGMLLSNR